MAFRALQGWIWHELRLCRYDCILGVAPARRGAVRVPGRGELCLDDAPGRGICPAFSGTGLRPVVSGVAPDTGARRKAAFDSTITILPPSKLPTKSGATSDMTGAMPVPPQL